MKTFLTLALLTAMAIPASANKATNNLQSVRLQQQRAAAASAAQAQANACGCPAYANGGVYNPQPAPAAPVVTP